MMSEEPDDFEGKWSLCSDAMREAGKAYPRTCQVCGLGPCGRAAASQAQAGPTKPSPWPVEPDRLVPFVDLQWAWANADQGAQAGAIIRCLVNEVRILRERVGHTPVDAPAAPQVIVHHETPPIVSDLTLRFTAVPQQSEPVTTSNLVRPPFQRAQLGTMAEEVRSIVYSYANRVSVAEALGVLEIVKQEIYRESAEAL